MSKLNRLRLLLVVLALVLSSCATERRAPTPALSEKLAPAAPAPNIVGGKSWEVDDKRIGAQGTAYIDNEYWQDGKKMAWMDGSLNLWLCDVEVSSGKLIPEDGKGIQIGKGAPFALAIKIGRASCRERV